jgi:hypothetical protein
MGDLLLSKYSWLRGRDLNPRPLGYEPRAAKPPGTARDDQGRFYWVNRGREATPDHPIPRQSVPNLSPRFLRARGVFAPPGASLEV